MNWWLDRRRAAELRERQERFEANRRARLLSWVTDLAADADVVRGVRPGTTMSELLDTLEDDRWSSAVLIRCGVQLGSWLRRGCADSFQSERSVAA